LADIPGARPVDTGTALSKAATISVIWLDDDQTAWAACKRAIDTLRSAGDDEALAEALSNHASLLAKAGRSDEARAEWLELRDQAADRGHTFPLVLALNQLCWLETQRGNLAAAVAYGQAGVEQSSENTAVSIKALIRTTLAEALVEQGEAPGPAIDMIAENVRLHSKLRSVEVLTTEMTLLAKALLSIEPRHTAVLIGAARVLEKRHGIGFDGRFADRDYIDRLLDQLRNRLGDKELTVAIESINDITFDEATDLAITLARQGSLARQPASETLGAR
jgi:hypothetical protein